MSDKNNLIRRGAAVRTRAVVLSCHVTGLGVIRALGMNGVPIVAGTYEKYDMGAVSKYVHEWVRLPHPGENEKEFVDTLLTMAPKWGHALLVPADDATLTAVSRNRSRLSEEFIVACPEWSVVQRFVNKCDTYRLAESLGVPAPKSVCPSSIDDVEAAIERFEFPCLAKPCIGHLYFEKFKRKMTKVTDADQLVRAYLEAEAAGLDIMIQEFIPGTDNCGANYNSYFWDGAPIAEATAKKIRLSPPETGVPRVIISKRIPEIAEPARKMLRALGFSGFSCTEFKKDARDGVYKFMEVNGRHNRSGLLSLRCGMNFPWLEYQHRVTGRLLLPETARDGVYWIDTVSDITQSVRSMAREHYSLGGYVGPYLHQHAFAILDWHDMKPFIRRCTDMIPIARDHWRRKHHKSA